MSDRRQFLRSLAALPLIGGSVAAVPALASPAFLLKDARLVALAEELEALDLACVIHTASHPGDDWDRWRDDLRDIDNRFRIAEGEVAETAAATIMGVLAKARALQIENVRDCCDAAVWQSLVDDLVRLHPAGVPLTGGAV